ncbi:MAG TPA: pyridoxine 5'-phosphate synthase [Anaerohalosphaeraceae bacterium]|jgi:pyridoxine 5-phosphate synthase|nr:pyridoxine 5'-phosphate synthase [Phycisphaerae bacterium]HOT73657.1 pyridoxine 5'-phosphate synthase [Anaerohalosphaeraceae bacterium]HQG06934.1 pyridoxine 5'-phosphate synthase [Anaerohalosphaeraceae bacterium]HQI08304.1 pyridoxine 5'-phosphate synthase [Anaerohalosphaeraceae bacterium]HQJ68635.1 pyridoxine 5'-phosphate synthase [Anaerohalosphaeraceae bacterium]
MALLNVNIDHVATIRQARLADEPDPVWAAVECELAGANGITVHLRQDRRHINDRDVQILKETAASKFNLEMSLAEPIVRIAEQVCPDQITLVPENRAELTTEGGLDCLRCQKQIVRTVKRMHRKGILVSAFILPEEKQILAAAEAGCDAVELHTGLYANAKTDAAAEKTLNQLRDGRDIALSAGLIVHAGHGLTYRNIRPVAQIEGLCEFNIGHSIISRAVLVGLREAVKEMIQLIKN